MEDIGTAIRYYRELNGLTQKELADKLSISPSTIGMYEQNRRTPDVNTLATLSRIFDVPLDNLIGAGTPISTLKDRESNGGYFFFFFDDLLRDVFKNRLQKSLIKKNMSISELCEAVSFDHETCQKYLNGEIEPSMENLIELSQALDVSTDYLLGQIPQISQVEKKIINTFVKLNEDNQDIIIGKAKELLKEQELSNSSVAAEHVERKVSGK